MSCTQSKQHTRSKVAIRRRFARYDLESHAIFDAGLREPLRAPPRWTARDNRSRRTATSDTPLPSGSSSYRIRNRCPPPARRCAASTRRRRARESNPRPDARRSRYGRFGRCWRRGRGSCSCQPTPLPVLNAWRSSARPQTAAAPMPNSPHMLSSLPSSANSGTCSGGSANRLRRRIVAHVSGRRLVREPLADVSFVRLGSLRELCEVCGPSLASALYRPRRSPITTDDAVSTAPTSLRKRPTAASSFAGSKGSALVVKVSSSIAEKSLGSP